MAELELVGIHADGEHIVLVDEEGQRHRLAIDDALRAAVRRDRPQLEQIRTEGLRPRDIQVLIRAGASAQDIAADAGVPIEQVRRYEGPALAERAHVAQRAKALTIGHEPGAPTLGDLVVDRLAARGAEDITWDARRRGSEPWEVMARFFAGDRTREATWQVDLAARSVTAIDDESRWLSETDLGAASRRHLSAVRPARLYDVETDADIAPAVAAVDAVIRDTRPGLRSVSAPPVTDSIDVDHTSSPAEATAQDSPFDAEADSTATAQLLEELTAARGVRQPVEIDDEALAAQVAATDAEATVRPHTPALWDEPAPDQERAVVSSSSAPSGHSTPSAPSAHSAPSGQDAPAAHPPASRPQDATDSTVLPSPPSRRSARHRRTSVPSWDEIVFGAKSDER